MLRTELTFRQRLDKIDYQGDIPKHYIDQHITFDIMNDPIKINGKYIMEYAPLAEHWNRKIQIYKNQGGDNRTSNSNSINDPIFITIAGGNESVTSLCYLKDLRSEIEGWLVSKELEYAIEIKKLEKIKALEKIDRDAELAIQKLEALLQHESTSGLTPQQAEQAASELITDIDNFNVKKSKLTLGARYYTNPTIRSQEMPRLLKKQEMGSLTTSEQEELIKFSPPTANPVLKRYSLEAFSFFVKKDNQLESANRIQVPASNNQEKNPMQPTDNINIASHLLNKQNEHRFND